MILQDPQMAARSRKVSSTDEIVSDDRLRLTRGQYKLQLLPSCRAVTIQDTGSLEGRHGEQFIDLNANIALDQPARSPAPSLTVA
jgi:hypothetical protein